MISYLEDTGQLENTIILYTSDQGFNLGEHDYIDKRWMYEETLRIPVIIRYPKRFARGTILEDMINNVDFAPTLLEMAGYTQATLPTQFQGRSFVSNLEGRTPPDWPKHTYYRYWMHMAHHDNPAHYGIRTQHHKLIFFYGLPLDAPGALTTPTPAWFELYDLDRDPFEMNNVAQDPLYANPLKELTEILLLEKQRIGDLDESYPSLLKIRKQILGK